MGKLLLAFFLLYTAFAQGQSQISGRIASKSGETLPGVSLLLKDANGKIVSFAISANNGGYSIEVKTPGTYTLEANSLGYEKQVAELAIGPDIKTITKDFTLSEGNTQLKEVVIEAEAPVRLKGDTLVYDAKALSTGTESVVEDLLRNIPGITILDDGTIKYGDRQVEKVMVDGDDLFNKGYSILTKNMPTQPLDKIEVLRNYSKNKLLKGVENSDAVALNLTIGEEFRNIWFGNLTAGYGNENRYRASGNLMNFAKNYKNFFSFGLNNAGYDIVGNISGMQYNSSDLETIGMGSRAAQLMSLGGKVSRIDEKRTRFNNAKMGTFSTIFPLGSKTKLRLNGFLGHDNLRTFQNSLAVSDFEGTYFENRETNNSVNTLGKGYVSAYLSSDLSDTQMLQSLTTFNNGKTDFSNSLVFNGISTVEHLGTKNTYFDQQLTYTQKWSSRNAVLLKTRFLTDRLPQNYGINDYLMGDLFSYSNINAVANDINSSRQYAGLQADFKLKQKNDDLIAFTVGFENNNDGLATRFSLFTDGGVINPEGFQAKASQNVGDLYAQSGYTWKKGKFTLGGNLNAHQLFNRFENAEGNATTQNLFFINPILSAGWELTPDNTLQATYMYNVVNSDILQVNDTYLLTSSRGFSRGLGYFNQLERSSANISYSTKHYLNRYSFSGGLTYSQQNDVISYRSSLNQNNSLSDAFVMRGGNRAGGNISLHYVIRSLRGSAALSATADRTIYYNVVNESGLRKNILYSQVVNFSWMSSFKSPFNFKAGTEWNFSKVKSDFTFNNTSKFSFLDLMYALGDRLDIKAKAEHYYFGGLDRNNNYFFADLEAVYSFQKDKYSVGLDGRNLFNTDVFTTYSISDVGYSTNSYRLLPRYVLLSFRYRF
ncbi:carboxypeptidase regulatory-like domain-containing protein [Flavobacterium sp. DGU11]|uniref:Carboxypeptidase regulatory-like domain-containing protein n=1 Tax=Flavobacterium arundinis TaxID=3139143 RepID=A0ABU9HX12_9FLAO